MALSGYSAAAVFGYSTARVKAMESKLLSKDVMHSVINAKDTSTMLAALYNTDYKSDINEFGGMDIKADLLDFALSKNLAKSLGKLLAATPTNYRSITRAIVGKWDLYNVRIAIEAKGKGMKYEDIAKYLVDYGIYNNASVKEALREESVEGIITKFMANSPYVSILQNCLDVYRKKRNALDAVAEIDKSYYKELSKKIIPMKDIGVEAARIIKFDIDMRNMLTLIRAKNRSLPFASISELLIEGGNIDKDSFESMYEGAKNIEELVSQAKGFDMKNALDLYKSDKSKRMLLLEIGMNNNIFDMSIKLLRHSVLSFTTILSYMYLKEIEIFTLRIFTKGMLYGLTKEEISKLVTWNL